MYVCTSVKYVPMFVHMCIIASVSRLSATLLAIYIHTDMRLKPTFSVRVKLSLRL